MIHTALVTLWHGQCKLLVRHEHAPRSPVGSQNSKWNIHSSKNVCDKLAKGSSYGNDNPHPELRADTNPPTNSRQSSVKAQDELPPENSQCPPGYVVPRTPRPQLHHHPERLSNSFGSVLNDASSMSQQCSTDVLKARTPKSTSANSHAMECCPTKCLPRFAVVENLQSKTDHIV